MGIFDFLKPKKPSYVGPTDIVLHGDFGAAEEIRGKLTKAEIAELKSLYPSLGDWSQKDLVIHMLQDIEPKQIRSIFADGLQSPTIETQAMCLCALYPNKFQFDQLLVEGSVSETLVEQAKARVAN